MTYTEATAQFYYYYTIKDVANGIDLEEIKAYLKMYEEAEMYEVCLGISRYRICKYFNYICYRIRSI